MGLQMRVNLADYGDILVLEKHVRQMFGPETEVYLGPNLDLWVGWRRIPRHLTLASLDAELISYHRLERIFREGSALWC